MERLIIRTIIHEFLAILGYFKAFFALKSLEMWNILNIF